LSRAVYANANNPPDKPLDPVVEEFLRFILSRDGQQVVRDHAIFLPLRGWQVVAARSAFLFERPGDCRFSKDRQ
jgi:phosphate transport system substrate-binding protein